jgi:hypothetical protein
LVDSLFTPQSASTRALEERKVKALESIAVSLERMARAAGEEARAKETETLST